MRSRRRRGCVPQCTALRLLSSGKAAWGGKGMGFRKEEGAASGLGQEVLQVNHNGMA